MPTYTLRTGAGPVNEHGAYLDAVIASLETYQVLTEAILTFASTGDFAVGETVTEATSGVTGVVYWKTATRLGIVEASDEFTGELAISGATSGESQTTTSVSNILEKTADTPRWSNIITTHNLTSAGALDPQTVYLNEATRHVMVWLVSGANVAVYNFNTDTLLYPIPKGGYFSFAVDYKTERIVLTFDAAGTCQVIEAKEDMP